jgi:hypothetical protein
MYNETAIVIVRKIEETELCILLGKSISSASRVITELLDSSLSSEAEAGKMILRVLILTNFMGAIYNVAN